MQQLFCRWPVKQRSLEYPGGIDPKIAIPVDKKLATASR